MAHSGLVVERFRKWSVSSCVWHSWKHATWNWFSNFLASYTSSPEPLARMLFTPGRALCLLVSSQLAQQKLLCRQRGKRKQQRFSFPRFILWTAGLLFLVPLNRKMSCPWSFWFPFGQSSHGTSWFILWAGPRRKIREQNRVGICPTLFVLNIYFPPLHTLVKKKKMEKDCQPLIFHFHSSPVPPWGYPWVKCGGEGEWGTHPLTSILHDLMLFMVSLPWFRSGVLR